MSFAPLPPEPPAPPTLFRPLSLFPFPLSPFFRISNLPSLMFPLIALPGPTASGKSALALSIARCLRAEILCVDSMTLYQHMSIGTAKPSPSDRAEVPHHALDLVPPTEEYTVARFVDLADGVIASCRARNVPLIAVGGTPLYFMSLFKGLFQGPPANPDLRASLSALPPPELHARLSSVDPPTAQRLHPNDTRRTIRALEVQILTGKPISEHQTEWNNNPLATRHPALWFTPDWPKDDLNKRINARARQMLAAGWLDEARHLQSLTTPPNPPLSKTALAATGYLELLSHLSGHQSLDTALEHIKIQTRQLARVQTKWFRRWPQLHTLPGHLPSEENAQTVLRHLETAAHPDAPPLATPHSIHPPTSI